MEGTTTLASVNLATTTPTGSGQYPLTVPGGPPAGRTEPERGLHRRRELFGVDIQPGHGDLG